ISRHIQIDSNGATDAVDGVAHDAVRPEQAESWLKPCELRKRWSQQGVSRSDAQRDDAVGPRMTVTHRHHMRPYQIELARVTWRGAGLELDPGLAGRRIQIAGCEKSLVSHHNSKGRDWVVTVLAHKLNYCVGSHYCGVMAIALEEPRQRDAAVTFARLIHSIQRHHDGLVRTGKDVLGLIQLNHLRLGCCDARHGPGRTAFGKHHCEQRRRGPKPVQASLAAAVGATASRLMQQVLASFQEFSIWLHCQVCAHRVAEEERDANEES